MARCQVLGVRCQGLLVAALVFAAACGAEEKRRLESVTWDLKSHKLTWVVKTGEVTEKYEIEPDTAVMAVKDEKRGFTKKEAEALHRLLDVLSVYCAESVDWWERGEGDRSPQRRGGTEKREAGSQKPGSSGLMAAAIEPAR